MDNYKVYKVGQVFKTPDVVTFKGTVPNYHKIIHRNDKNRVVTTNTFSKGLMWFKDKVVDKNVKEGVWIPVSEEEIILLTILGTPLKFKGDETILKAKNDQKTSSNTGLSSTSGSQHGSP